MTDWPVTFIVTGQPVPQGSKVPRKLADGRIVLTEGSGKHHAEWKMWRELVRTSALSYTNRAKRTMPHLRPEIEALQSGPIEVDLLFWMRTPKTMPKTRWLPDVKPDLDKLIRAVFDGITDSRLWGDDAQVCTITASKVYADDRTEPGVRVRVRSVSEGCLRP